MLPVLASRPSPLSRSPPSGPRVVLAHDWLTGMRGGERVLEELCRMFPAAPLLTLLHVRGSVSAVIENRPIHTSLLDRLPGVGRHYRQLLPLMPAAVEALRVPPCDLLLSSSHAAIKALRPALGARHLCYLHTPMRYLWDAQEAYFGPGRTDGLTRLAAQALLPTLRRWDVATARRVDRFVCNTHHVAARARRVYSRQSAVVHPFVDLERFRPTPAPLGPAAERAPYLMVTAFAPYKGIETALAAFRRLDRPLEVVGGGQLFEKLRPAFDGQLLKALGPLPDSGVEAALRRCRALILPAAEDFGIAALEAMASGRPVIALARGGACETVVPLETRGATGVLYRDSGDPVGDLAAAVRRFERNAPGFQPAIARARAEQFSATRFRQGLTREIEALLSMG